RCSVENLYFTSNVASQTAMLNVQAADCTLSNCEFDHANATTQAALVILGNASADRLRIDACYFHGTNNAGTSAAVSLAGGNDVKVVNSFFIGAYHASNGVIKNATTDCLNLHLFNNVIQNLTAVNTKCIVLTSGSTGQISDNNMQILSGTAPITGAA